jgi:dTMP kinase
MSRNKNMDKGRFIVIEGVDGSGKTTQFELLKKKLQKLYKNIKVEDFPRYYDSVWGKMVGEFLTGKYGKFDQVSPFLAVFPYMVDQYTWSRETGRLYINKGGIILSNRYFTSNVHQIAKLKGRARGDYRKWLWHVGYDELGILKPDLVIFLDVPSSISRKMNKNKTERLYLKGRKKDNAEKDYQHQLSAYKEYLYTVKHYSFWKKVKCTTKGEIDAPEVVHERVWKVVEKVI